MNPSLKKLQDKLIKHTAPSKRSPKKKLKITETVKDENGEIIDVKEIEIEQPVKEEVIFKFKVYCLISDFIAEKYRYHIFKKSVEIRKDPEISHSDTFTENQLTLKIH